MGSDFDHLHGDFNIEDSAFAEQFEDVLEHLVSKCPVARSQVGPGYRVFNRYRRKAIFPSCRKTATLRITPPGDRR